MGIYTSTIITGIRVIQYNEEGDKIILEESKNWQPLFEKYKNHENIRFEGLFDYSTTFNKSNDSQDMMWFPLSIQEILGMEK